MREGVPWDFPTLFAPMQGVGVKGVRELIASLGLPGVICTPFIRITAQAPSIPWLLTQIEHALDVPLSVQLMGNHPQHLAQAAQALSAAGVDVVDFNLGCPSRQVNRKSAGAALLSNAEEVSRIVSSMRAACRCRLSVKMRASDAPAAVTIQLAQRIAAAGADFLVIHPRTRVQGYTGVSDWNLVKQVKAELTIPVVGNGDLWYAADVMRLMRVSGVDAVMLGRPALRNPFIFRQIRELWNGRPPYLPTGADIVGHIERLAGLFGETLKDNLKGPQGALKEQVKYLLRGVPEPTRASLWLHTARAGSLEEVLEAIRPLEDVPVLDLGADGPLRLELTPASPLG